MQRRITHNALHIAALVFLATAASNASAQSVFAYPTKGQTEDQIRKDERDCQMWAMERTGFNPRQGPPQSYSSAPSGYSDGGSGFGSGETGQGGVIRDGARGAALGAIGGAIAGDAGKGAAWGAFGGAILGGAKRSRRKQQEADWQRQQQQQLQQQQQQQMAQYQQSSRNFDSAYGLCMEARDYRVNY